MKPICSMPDCGKPCKAHGLCGTHYQRLWSRGTTELAHMPAKGLQCSVPGCDDEAKTKGLCRKHYQRLRKHGDPLVEPRVKMSPKGAPAKFYEEVVLAYDGDECLTWPFHKGIGGYAKMWRDGEQGFVQRFLCTDVYGPPPTPEHQAAHSCGKGHLACVAKKHLSWKTPKENMADRVGHGTINRGKRHGQVKLTEQQAREVIALRGKVSQYVLARRFGISQATVSDIQLRKHWSWLSEGAE